MTWVCLSINRCRFHHSKNIIKYEKINHPTNFHPFARLRQKSRTVDMVAYCRGVGRWSCLAAQVNTRMMQAEQAEKRAQMLAAIQAYQGCRLFLGCVGSGCLRDISRCGNKQIGTKNTSEFWGLVLDYFFSRAHLVDILSSGTLMTKAFLGNRSQHSQVLNNS